MLDKLFPLYIIAFILTLTLTVVFEKNLIPKLRTVAKQPIYEDGPRWHMAKSGTPTMGGLAFVLSSLICALLLSPFLYFCISERSAFSLLSTFLYAFLNAAVGLIDDITKLRKKENSGLTPRQKLVLQLLCAVLFLLFRQIVLDEGTAIKFSFGMIDLGFFYYPVALFIMLGLVNSTNLTDGVDGLASSVAFACGISLFYVSAAGVPEVGVTSSVLIGAAIGFLIFNLHPAKIFMGDTGSLFFGALITAVGFELQNPFIILFFAAVYVIEGISVVLQVLYFKATGKRIFIMAPLHHHLEKCGWSENKICIVSILLTLLFSIPAYIFYLP